MLAELALELAQDEIRDRCNKLEREPLGHVVVEGIRRRAAIKEQGREPNDEDVRQFVSDIPDIVARAKALKGEE